MKLLLVLGSDDIYDIISKSMRSLGFDIIRYRNILKAMDNITEIEPSAIVISARNFPRHWKILVQFVRNERAKEICPIIILKGESFGAEETSKAFYLGVNGIVDDSLENHTELDRLHNILARTAPITEKRKYQRYYVEPWHRIDFLVINLAGRSITTGDVKTISCNGLSFYPVNPAKVNENELLGEFRECSLRVGDAILSPVCRLVRVGRIVSFEFISFAGDGQQILNQYLDDFPLLEPGKDFN